MSVPAEFTYFPDSRPAAMVVSHERSGTHFLMNSLAACYGYVSLPWINFDHPTDNILTHLTHKEIRELLEGMVDRPMANVVKSHHTVEFFAEELEPLTQRYVLFAIYRHPVDVMLSFWRFMYNFQPKDGFGPQTPDPASFALTAPSGLILRYQTQPHASILDRWAAHVRGWHRAAQTNPRIRLVRYEDLNDRFEDTMQSFEPALGRSPQSLKRPAKDYNVIRSGPANPTGNRGVVDIEALEQLCRDKVGDTMALLGY